MQLHKSTIFGIIFLLLSASVQSQKLSPGFNSKEYRAMLAVNSQHITDSSLRQEMIDIPDGYLRLYRSPEIGFANRWDLYLTPDSVGVISIRGSVKRPLSWLCNGYAAMVPAKGIIQLSDTMTVDYKVAGREEAAVHVGWLIGMLFLGHDILPRIDSLYQHKVRDFLIIGHSQGGAISYLLTSQFHYWQEAGVIPVDIRFKTYCSAAPKPGNLYYAYDFETVIPKEMAYNVVSTEDWVPETPLSIQAMHDFSRLNPFADVKKQLRQVKFPKRLVLKYTYKQLARPAARSQKRFERYLGHKVEKLVVDSLPGFKPPVYFKSNHYVRTARTVLLTPDEKYFELFKEPSIPELELFINHLFKPYYYLAKQLDGKCRSQADSSITGYK